MANIAATPFVLRNLVLRVAADNFEKSVSGVTFTPATSSVTWQGGTPDASYTMPGTTTWSVTIDYAQDWAAATSLSRLLFDNDGVVKNIQFIPINGGPGFKADVILVPGPIGGAVGAAAAASVTLGVQGKPTAITAVTP
ncbi:hypothetical protein ASF48_06990 [Rathayibacter sp. Leaf299]|uniref:hypothetical protein n=1 Tax=Rathayibacter sp. Leaf299 TaxID=1736328 RepID=UPI0006FE8CE1|nr:hypothetical protein [Rathayibacter sp. Leaf299]KQQ22876.1 hypothetical protein ASF48_06990 [Rathayibacter sp. Leaf299]